MQAITIVKAIVEAEKVYYLASGSYTTTLDDLDVTFPQESFNGFGELIIHTSPILHVQIGRKIENKWVWVASYLRENKTIEVGCTTYISYPSFSMPVKLCESLSNNATPQIIESGYYFCPIR